VHHNSISSRKIINPQVLKDDCSCCIVESTFLTFAVRPLSMTHNTSDQPPHMAVLKRKSTWTVSLWDTGIVFSCPQGTNQRYSLYLYENTLICMKQRCSRSFWYSRSLGLLASVVHGMITYIQQPLEIGRRGSVGRRLNGNTLAVVNRHLRPLRESVAYVRAVGVGVPATVIS
jgi:hypothetical protein